jgi:glyoxylase-like metal-dependent hydrolase (beta-lactamase superfamily II)
VDFGAYAVHSGDTITLVDTGLGPPPGEENFMYRRQGWLPQSLRDAGIAPADVDIVFSTHHHSDHIGWNTIAGRPHFDRARYVSPAESWEWTMANRTEGLHP